MTYVKQHYTTEQNHDELKNNLSFKQINLSIRKIRNEAKYNDNIMLNENDKISDIRRLITG